MREDQDKVEWAYSNCQGLSKRAGFLHPFRHSAISCIVPAISMLHLFLLNHFLFTASKNSLVKSLICHKISHYGPFQAGFTHFFSLSSVHRSFRLRHCVLHVHVCMHVCVLAVSSYVRKLCACPLVLSRNIFSLFSF